MSDDSNGRRLTSVICHLLRVPGLARQHAGVNTELLERPIVFGADVGAEDKVAIGGAMQPTIVLNLGLELPARPSRVAERQQRLPRTVAFCDRLEDVKRRGEADTVIDRQGRILDKVIA